MTQPPFSPASPTIVGLAGSLFSPSRSGALVERTLSLLHTDATSPTQLVDLAKLSADGLLARTKDAEVDQALQTVTQATVLVVGTPVYRATYAGQLKAFFDLLPRDALKGTVVGLIATGAGRDHALSVDNGLRPLVASLSGLAASRGIYVSDAELGDFPKSAPVPDAVDALLHELAAELRAVASALTRAAA